MKNIYVTATDIDFSTDIGNAFRCLVTNQDFLNAYCAEQKTALCHVANGLAMAKSALLGWNSGGYVEYLLSIVKVSDTKPTEDFLDVMYTYCPYTKEVY